MNTVHQETPLTNRVLSVDLLRGLTILVMIFVNDVASVKGLPWWTYHIPPGEQGITYVDVVFPAFLFIMGMAIPLAIKNRLSKGDSRGKVFIHIVIRSLSLVAIGVLIMNGRAVYPGATGLSYTLWNVLMFIGVILFWNNYTNNKQRKLRWIGLLLLIVLLVLYRRKEGDEIVWIDPGNAAILGGLGWSYLSCGILYLLLGKRIWKLGVALIVLIVLNVLTKAGMVAFIRDVPVLLWPFKSGALASVTLSGVIMAVLFLEHKAVQAQQDKFIYGITFTVLLLSAAWLLLPFGLAKIGSTPSWCLFSAGFTAAIFMITYWFADIKKIRTGTALLNPAGSNPLLTYILPDVYYAIFTIYHFQDIAGHGLPGVIRAMLFALFILALSTLLTRLKIRLQV